MAKMHGKKRVSGASKHYINGWWYTDYEVGHLLWQCRKPLPMTASRAMQQGYVNGAKEQDLSLVASMRHQERAGRFEFLPKYHGMSAFSGNPLRYGQKGRYLVGKARRHQERAMMAQNEDIA